MGEIDNARAAIRTRGKQKIDFLLLTNVCW